MHPLCVCGIMHAFVWMCTRVCTTCKSPLSCGFWESGSGCQACLLNTFNLLSNLTDPLFLIFWERVSLNLASTAKLVSFKDPLIFTLNCCYDVSALLLYQLLIYVFLYIYTEDPNSGLFACMAGTLPSKHCPQPLDPQNLK